MLFKSLLSAAAIGASLLSTASASAIQTKTKRQDAVPIKWGILAFPGLDILDIYGPLEILYFVAANRHIQVTIITPSDAPVVVNPPMGNPFNSTYETEVIGQATMDDLDLDLDILLVPGGAAARAPDTEYIDEYLKVMVPKVDYFLTICTGALFAARAGLFDGRRVTTNKRAWNTVTVHGDNVTWVAPARYVVDDRLWSSSGVSAGIDMTFAFVKEFYGEALHDTISDITEHEPRAHDDDPFTDKLGVPHQGQL